MKTVVIGYADQALSAAPTGPEVPAHAGDDLLPLLGEAASGIPRRASLAAPPQRPRPPRRTRRVRRPAACSLRSVVTPALAGKGARARRPPEHRAG